MHHSWNPYPIRRGRRNIGLAISVTTLLLPQYHVFAKICTQWMGFHMVCHPSLTTFLAMDAREFRDYGSYSLCSRMKASLLANVRYSRMISLISYTDVYSTGLQFLNSCLMFSAYECGSISGALYRWWVENCVQFLFCLCSFCSCLFLAVDMSLVPGEIRRLIKRQWESHRPCELPQDIYPDAYQRNLDASDSRSMEFWRANSMPTCFVVQGAWYDDQYKMPMIAEKSYRIYLFTDRSMFYISIKPVVGRGKRMVWFDF